MKIPLKRYIKLLYTYVSPQKGKLLILFLLLGGSIALQLINPQIVRSFIDNAMNGTTSRTLYISAGFYILFAIIQQGLSLLSTYLSQEIGWNSTNKMRVDLIRHCVNLDMSFHKGHKPGELIERVDGDVTELFNFFSNFIINILNNLVLVIGILILLFREDFRIGIALTLFCIVTLKVLWRTQSTAVGHWVNNKKANAEFFGFVGEQIISTEDIKALGAVPFFLNKFNRLVKNWFPLKLKADLMHFRMWTTSIVIFTIGNIISFGVGGYLKLSGIISLGTVYLIFNYTELIRKPLEQIRRQFEDLQKSSASIVRIEELLKEKSSMEEGDKVIQPYKPMTIEAKNVCFQYDEDCPVLENVSFKLTQGRTLGILGRTGSGKSTLSKLLIRLYDPTSGEILINGVSLKNIAFPSLRDNIAFVTQEVQLFKGTIKDNLTLFNKEISDEAIYEAIESIGLKLWINSMQDGIYTMLGPGGEGLSAGEAQLLAFVRVFLKNPSLIIMDEASSRLDPATEQLMESAMNKLLEGRACIIIAHRLQTVQRADEILILEEGNIKEYGDREKLISIKDSHYNHLLKVGLEEVVA